MDDYTRQLEERVELLEKKLADTEYNSLFYKRLVDKMVAESVVVPMLDVHKRTIIEDHYEVSFEFTLTKKDFELANGLPGPSQLVQSLRNRVASNSNQRSMA
jgi:hypothetical protein